MSDTDLVDSTSLIDAAASTAAPDLGQVDEHDVTERVLGVVGDADRDLAVLDADPLVVGGVAEVVGDLHGAGGYRNPRPPVEG